MKSWNVIRNEPSFKSSEKYSISSPYLEFIFLTYALRALRFSVISSVPSAQAPFHSFYPIKINKRCYIAEIYPKDSLAA